MSKRMRILAFVLVMVFAFSSIIIYPYAQAEDVEVFEDEGTAQPTLNVQEEQTGPLFELESESAILVDAGSGQVLFEKKCHERLRPASVTKVMSLLLIMEAIDTGKIKLSDIVTCSEYAAGMGGSQIWLEPGEQMTVDDLLKCVTVGSANDATVALAEHIYGSIEAFVNEMNSRAKKLGMKDTNFVNATGLDADNHYTSAYDIALVSRELLSKYPLIHKYTTIWMDTVRDGEFGLANTNKLIKFYDGCDGIKTGSTSKSLFCLSATAVRSDLRLIAVVMAAPTSKIRFAETSKLFDHGFASFSSVLAAKKGEAYGTVKVAKGIKGKIDCVMSEDARVLVRKGKEETVERVISLPEKVKAPVEKGQKIGEVEMKTREKKLASFDLVAAESVGKATFVKLFTSIVDRWFTVGR